MLRSTSAEIITQVITVTEKLSNEEFARPLAILNGSSIGKNIRHIIEFYDCLLRGYKNGTVNYDAREHNTLLENDKFLATETLEIIKEKIMNSSDKQLTLLVNFSNDEAAVNSIATTVYRELIYNIEHVVHHAAIIKIALKNSFPEVAVPENFGIAYSTVKYAKQQQEEEKLHVQ